MTYRASIPIVAATMLFGSPVAIAQTSAPGATTPGTASASRSAPPVSPLPSPLMGNPGITTSPGTLQNPGVGDTTLPGTLTTPGLSTWPGLRSPSSGSASVGSSAASVSPSSGPSSAPSSGSGLVGAPPMSEGVIGAPAGCVPGSRVNPC